MKNTDFLKTFTIKSIALYLIALTTVSVIFCRSFVGWQWVLWGVGSVILFFVGTWYLDNHCEKLERKKFLLLVFFIALIIRVLYAWLMCYYYTFQTGKPLEFNPVDSLRYHRIALSLENVFANHQLGELIEFISGKYVSYSDLGYVTTLAAIYWIFGPNILIPRIIHALLSAYMCVVIYKLCSRVFDEKTAKLAAVMSVVMPLFVYYCGLHLKEADFAFFLILCIERIDFVIREKKNIWWNIIIILFSMLMVFSYRISTGICLVLSFVVYVIVTKQDTVTLKAKIVSLATSMLVIVALIFSGFGWEIIDTFRYAFTRVDYNFQYLPGAFVLPLPKMIADGNENQKLINGMVFVKNIIGFFAMYSLVIACREKKLREISLVALVPMTYLAIVASIRFFSMERFYFPVLPCLTVLAAYSISHFEKNDQKWFNFYLAALLIAIIFWNYYNVNSL